jgi:proteic killer suppression protein
MIRSVKGTATHQFIRGGRTRFRGLDENLARQRLAELNAAPSLDALSPLRSVHLHKLKGERSGSWAMNVNGPWRIMFRFKDGHAYDVEIVDYH